MHPFEADSSKKSLGLQLMCIGQFPIAPAAPPVHHRPRLRALALLERRPHQRVEGHVIPASEKPIYVRVRQRFEMTNPGNRRRGDRLDGQFKTVSVGRR